MFKKVINIFLVFLLLLNFLSITVFATIEIDEEITSEDLDEIVREVSNNVTGELNINSRVAVAYDRTSKQVIWGKNENKVSAMASTTKIMTAIVTLENASLDDMVIVSSKAAWTGGSSLGLKTNDKIMLKDLLYGLMLRSGNDAAVAIAEHVGGSVEGFAELMNKKAEDLNLKNTHFVTPHGLDDPNHFTTAYELAALTDYALENEKFKDIVKTKEYIIKINGYDKKISNTNELLGYINGVNGVKTGFTNNAGRCLVTSVSREGWDIIVVVLQADTKKFRGADTIKIIEYIYKNYQLINLEDIINEQLNGWYEMNKKKFKIEKAKAQVLEVKLSEMKNNIVPIKKVDIDNVDIKINCLFNLKAPVEEDFIIGNVKVIINEKVLEVLEMENKIYVPRKGIFDYFKMFFEY